MRRHQAHAERAAQFAVVKTRHSERTLHVGFARARLRDAAEVGLQVAKFHGRAAFGGGSGDAFADGDGRDHGKDRLGYAALGDEFKKLIRRIQPVQRAGAAAKVGEGRFQDGRPAWNGLMQQQFNRRVHQVFKAILWRGRS